MEEVEGDPNPGHEGDSETDEIDVADRCWWDEDDECWLTDFPPPPGFDGYQSRGYDELDDDEPYVRGCTAEEVFVLAADAAALAAAERSDDEALRDEWFDALRSGLCEADSDESPLGDEEN